MKHAKLVPKEAHCLIRGKNRQTHIENKEEHRGLRASCMLKSVLERLDAGQLINSEANYATQLKSLFQKSLWLFFWLQQL